MGWLFTFNSKRNELIARITADYESAKCIRHCYRGSVYNGILWSVWEYTGNTDKPGYRFIRCDLMRYSRHDNGWGYKDMTESMHPYYYSCPLSYLNLAPEENREWREGVREYWKRQRRIQAIKIGDVVRLRDCKVPEVTLTHKTKDGWIGQYGDSYYRVPKNHIVLGIEVETK